MISTVVAWISTAGAATRAERHVCTIRRAAASGELHGHQRIADGHRVRKGRWVFAPDAVDAWVQGLDELAQKKACGCAALRAVRRAS